MLKLGRKATRTTGRQRQRSLDTSQVSNYNYRDQSTPAVTQRDQPPTKRLSDNFWLQRVGSIILLIAIVASVVNVLTLSSSAKVLPLSGSNQTFLHNTNVYQQAVDSLLKQSIWNHNKLTINTGRLADKLEAQFPELSSVSVTLPLLAHRPIVYVAANQPVLILLANNGAYVVDSTGRALLSTSQLPSNDQLNVPTISDQSGLTVTAGQQVLTSDNVSFIQIVTAQLQAAHLTIASMNLPVHTSELDVAISGQPYYVKFNLQSNDAKQQVGTFLAVLSKGIVPQHYIDVRVDGRAYYQ